MPGDRSLETLTADDFRAVLASRFLLTANPPGGGSPVSLPVELVDVTEHSAGGPDVARNPFSLLFHGPLAPVLPQGIYRLEQERFGAVALFIVPVGPSDPPAPGEAPAAMRYEAVFS